MRGRAIGTGALLALLTACGGGTSEDGNRAGNASAKAAPVSDAQNRVRDLPEGQRNGMLIRAIRDARQKCQHVEQSIMAQTANNVPVYMATCEDGAVYAVAIANDGSASVRAVTPAEGR